MPTNPVAYFENYTSTGKRVPKASSCLNNLPNLCSGLHSFGEGCWNATSTAEQIPCFCSALARTSCPGLCTAKQEAKDYIHWIQDFCDPDLNYFHFQREDKYGRYNRAFIWPDRDAVYTNAGLGSYDTAGMGPYNGSLFPWTWRISPDPAATSTVHCPSTSLKLGSFAAINLVIGALSIVFGRRSVVRRVTCGMFGQPGSRVRPLMGVISALLNILANYINALLIKRIPSFSDIPVGNLVIFWCTRPRIAWIATALVFVDRQESMYFSIAASSMLSEIILQCCAAVYMGITVQFARVRGLYKKNALHGVPDADSAQLMYDGTMLWLVSIGFAYLIVILSLLGVWGILARFIVWLFSAIANGWRKLGNWFAKALFWRKGSSSYLSSENLPSFREEKKFDIQGAVIPVPENHEQQHDYNQVIRKMGLQRYQLYTIQLFFIPMGLPYIGQWLFWAGYIRLAGNLYCPPPIWQMTGIWTLFSSVALFLGAAP